MKFIGLLGDNTSLSDITSVSVESDSGGGNGYYATSGDVQFKILGGDGISTSNSSNVFTVTVEASQINHDSLAGFVGNEHIDWSVNYLGADIAAGNIPTLNQDTTGEALTAATATKLATQRDLKVDLAETNEDGFDGSANALNIGVGTSVLGVSNGGTGLTSISTLVNPTLIDSDTMSGASATNVASAESIKAYVDARYSYQYISFFGSVSAANNNSGGPYYLFTSGNGISNHSWTKYNMGGSSLAITNDTIDLVTDSNCSQLAVSTYLAANQIVVPQTSEIVGFYATNRSGSNGYHVGNAIFVVPESGVNWGDSTAMTGFLKYRSISSAHSGTDENYSGSNVNTSKVMMCHDMTRGTYEVAAGSIIIPSVFCDTHSQVVATSMTIVLRTKI